MTTDSNGRLERVREAFPSHGRYGHLDESPRHPWPDGRRLAVYMAVGIEEYRFGEGRVENLLEGIPAPDLVNASWRDYGNRVGAARIFSRLRQFGITPTVLLNTAVYDSAPHVIAAARQAGAEIVAHGISNSDCLEHLSEPEERKYLESVANRIAHEEGTKPLGWSSPWLTHTTNTLDLLGETGYRYVLDLRPDDRVVELNTRAVPLVAIPYSLELNDSTSIISRGVGALEFADMIIDEFDELLLQARAEPLVMSVVVHSFISGAPFRLRQLTRALEHLASHGDDAWLTTPREIYEHTQVRSAVP